MHRNRSSSSFGRKIIPRGRKRSRRNASPRRKRSIRLKRRGDAPEWAFDVSRRANPARVQSDRDRCERIGSRRETRLGASPRASPALPSEAAEPRREMASSSLSASKRKPRQTSHFVALRSQISPPRPALIQSLRASAAPLDPPSEWLTQRAPPLPKLTQSASADNPGLPVLADESHAKNSATVAPTKIPHSTIKAISLADRRRKFISTADASSRLSPECSRT